MKKFISVLLMLCLAVCFVACGDKDIQNEVNLLDNSGDSIKTIQKYFNEAELDKFAETQTIKLPEDSTTGFEWIYVIDDAEVIEIVKDEFVLAEGFDTIDGGSGERVCEIKGLEEGETILYFNYVNGNNASGDVEDTVKFYVEVNANKEIAVTDEIH